MGKSKKGKKPNLGKVEIALHLVSTPTKVGTPLAFGKCQGPDKCLCTTEEECNVHVWRIMNHEDDW